VTAYVRMLSAALSTSGRSIFFVHTCAGLASYTLTPTTEGMQLKAPQGKIVLEYKTKIPADHQSPSAAYFNPVKGE
jgi:hypothetical protein